MNKQMKQYEVLKWASLFLEKHNCEKGVAEILLQHHVNVSRSQFLMNMREVILDDVVHLFKADVKMHVETGVPVQHLTGYEYFYGRCFSVNEHVLIPRPETEELVQHAIKMVKEKYVDKPITIVDVGTGSGIIAITLALEVPQATVYATDISDDALKVAKKNAAHLGADVTFLKGNFLQSIIDEKVRPEIIISNPPYISKAEEPTLSKTVRNFDPSLALFADDDGLAAYKTIIKQTSSYLTDVSMILFEIGHEQASTVSAIVKSHFPNREVDVIKDINEKDRIIRASISV